MIYRSSARLFLFTLLAIFTLGYVFRYLFITYYIHNNIALPPEYLDWHFVNQAPLNGAMIICVVVFGIFVALFAATTRFRDCPPLVFKKIPLWAIFTFTAFIAASLVVRAVYGAALGQEATNAGFIFGTLNYRLQSDFLPALILLLMEIAWVRGEKKQYYFAIALLALFFLGLSAITTSKAGMINFLALVIMLMYLTGQSIWKYPIRLFIGVFAGVLTYIVASQLRAYALGIGDSAIWVSMQDGNVLEATFQVVGLIANRIPGVEGLALSCGYSCDTLPFFTFPALDRSAVEIFTYDIIGIRHANDFRSPGIIGGATLLAGVGGGAAMVIASLFAGKTIAGVMDRNRFSAAARAAFAFGMLRFMMEGAWYWVDIATMLAGVATTELVARLWVSEGRAQSETRSAAHVDSPSFSTPS